MSLSYKAYFIINLMLHALECKIYFYLYRLYINIFVIHAACMDITNLKMNNFSQILH